MRQTRQAFSTFGLELVRLRWGCWISVIVCMRVLSNFWFRSTRTASMGTSFIPEMYLQIIAQKAFSHRNNIMNNLWILISICQSGILLNTKD